VSTAGINSEGDLMKINKCERVVTTCQCL